MKVILAIIATSLLVSGCATSKKEDDNVKPLSRIDSQPVYKSDNNALFLTHVTPELTANNYSAAIVEDLIKPYSNTLEQGYVGVTDFSYISSALDEGSLLSNHLSEALIYDLHKANIPVLDYKVTDFIRVTPTGDFALSRDFTELTPQLPIRYVITGTITSHEDGVLINARLIEIDTKRVMATARTFMPQNIVQALRTKSAERTLQLHQG